MARPGEGAGAMAVVNAAKRALRAELKRRLRALSEAEKLRQSRLLAAQVVGHSKYRTSRRIAVFLSMSDEVQTAEIIKDMFQQDGLDLILMPGLGFDKTGNRLGRGKGYYDTYLKRCTHHHKGKPYTIALAFKEQICDVVPASENDMKVDEILFEPN
ncbi:5-formyltetrahydrofolate cyclo-ligase isoform X2 [Paroedura picta]|uniref:5-formyltetrahydrofolate cyclo-ligase isoform X2 n=1 Tax=Paroedura picta TaxID=143630 RepID=UPI00405724CC